MFYFQLKEMEKKLSDYRKGSVSASPAMSGNVPRSPAVSGKFDGTYCVQSCGTDNPTLTDDSIIHRPFKFRHNSSVAHRLSRSFRERNLLKYHKFIDSGSNSSVPHSGISVKGDRNSSAFNDAFCLLDESKSSGSTVSDTLMLDDTRSADLSLDATENSSEESYKISNDSLYPSSYKYIQEESKLDLSFLTPPPVLKRREVACMSPKTRRSKRASWHHTMFQKLSPQVGRANKETAV